jgi:hypothetical protein
MILHVSSKVTALQMFSAPPALIGLLASKRGSKKNSPSPEFDDMSTE